MTEMTEMTEMTVTPDEEPLSVQDDNQGQLAGNGHAPPEPCLAYAWQTGLGRGAGRRPCRWLCRFSQYWIGSYTGSRAFSIWVTPFVIEAAGAESPPDIPSGYAMTVALGKLIVQGVRFTEPALQVEMAAT